MCEIRPEQYEEIIKDCDKAIEIDPKNSGAYYNRGNAKSKLGRYGRGYKRLRPSNRNRVPKIQEPITIERA